MSRHKTPGRTTLIKRVALIATLALASMHASATLVTSRAALGGNDFVDWGQLGASFDFPPNPASVTSNLGLAADVSKATSGSFLLLNAADHGGNLGGNILSTFFEAGPITLDFGVGLAKIGAQIQSNDFGAFNGMISAYNSANVLLETWSFGGVSNGNQDDSGIFIGISRSVADIDHVIFDITGPNNLDFAINRVDLNRTPDQINLTPEPASLALAGLSLLTLLATRRRKH